MDAKEQVLRALRPRDGSPSFALVDGMRLENRFSLWSHTFELGIASVLHTFRSTCSPFYDFAGSGEAGLELHALYIRTEEYVRFLEARFALAAEVHQEVFEGKRNAAQPSVWVYPVLADLANSLGIHNGETYVGDHC